MLFCFHGPVHLKQPPVLGAFLPIVLAGSLVAAILVLFSNDCIRNYGNVLDSSLF